MRNSFFDRLPASAFDMPEKVSRQWILEHSDLGGRILTKTPNWAEVPIPDGRAGQLFTHALYIADCDCEEPCACADNDAVSWNFVEYFNSNGDVQAPGVRPDIAPILDRILGEK